MEMKLRSVEDLTVKKNVRRIELVHSKGQRMRKYVGSGLKLGSGIL